MIYLYYLALVSVYLFTNVNNSFSLSSKECLLNKLSIFNIKNINKLNNILKDSSIDNIDQSFKNFIKENLNCVFRNSYQDLENSNFTLEIKKIKHVFNLSISKKYSDYKSNEHFLNQIITTYYPVSLNLLNKHLSDDPEFYFLFHSALFLKFYESLSFYFSKIIFNKIQNYNLVKMDNNMNFSLTSLIDNFLLIFKDDTELFAINFILKNIKTILKEENFNEFQDLLKEKIILIKNYFLDKDSDLLKADSFIFLRDLLNKIKKSDFFINTFNEKKINEDFIRIFQKIILEFFYNALRYKMLALKYYWSLDSNLFVVINDIIYRFCYFKDMDIANKKVSSKVFKYIAMIKNISDKKVVNYNVLQSLNKYNFQLPVDFNIEFIINYFCFYLFFNNRHLTFRNFLKFVFQQFEIDIHSNKTTIHFLDSLLTGDLDIILKTHYNYDFFIDLFVDYFNEQSYETKQYILFFFIMYFLYDVNNVQTTFKQSDNISKKHIGEFKKVVKTFLSDSYQDIVNQNSSPNQKKNNNKQIDMIFSIFNEKNQLLSFFNRSKTNKILNSRNNDIFVAIFQKIYFNMMKSKNDLYQKTDSKTKVKKRNDLYYQKYRANLSEADLLLDNKKYGDLLLQISNNSRLSAEYLDLQFNNVYFFILKGIRSLLFYGVFFYVMSFVVSNFFTILFGFSIIILFLQNLGYWSNNVNFLLLKQMISMVVPFFNTRSFLIDSDFTKELVQCTRYNYNFYKNFYLLMINFWGCLCGILPIIYHNELSIEKKHSIFLFLLFVIVINLKNFVNIFFYLAPKFFYSLFNFELLFGNKNRRFISLIISIQNAFVLFCIVNSCMNLSIHINEIRCAFLRVNEIFKKDDNKHQNINNNKLTPGALIMEIKNNLSKIHHSTFIQEKILQLIINFICFLLLCLICIIVILSGHFIYRYIIFSYKYIDSSNFNLFNFIIGVFWVCIILGTRYFTTEDKNSPYYYQLIKNQNNIMLLLPFVIVIMFFLIYKIFEILFEEYCINLLPFIQGYFVRRIFK